MSGHSKWHSIKHKKALLDSKKGKIFTKIIREITVASRDGGGDIDGNAKLRLVVQKAKEANMPFENIDKAIKKGTGELEGVNYESVVYEGYGACGVAVILDVLTDNKNRTVAELRRIFSKHQGRLAEAGSVLWMFEKKGMVVLDARYGEDEIMELVIEQGALDVVELDGKIWVYTNLEDFENVKKVLRENKKKLEDTQIQRIAKDLLQLEAEKKQKILFLLEQLEDHDDVQSMSSNLEL